MNWASAQAFARASRRGFHASTLAMQEAMGSSHNMFGSVTTVYLRTDGCSAPALNNTDGTGRPYEPGAARPGRESATDTSNDFHGGPSPCIGAGSHGDPGDRKRGSGGFCVDHIIRGDTIEQVLETSQVSDCDSGSCFLINTGGTGQSNCNWCFLCENLSDEFCSCSRSPVAPEAPGASEVTGAHH